MRRLCGEERYRFFADLYRRLGRPVDFRLEGDVRVYYFRGGLAVVVRDEGQCVVVEERAAPAVEVLSRGEFSKIAISFSAATVSVALVAALAEVALRAGVPVLAAGLTLVSAAAFSAAKRAMRRAPPLALS